MRFWSFFYLWCWALCCCLYSAMSDSTFWAFPYRGTLRWFLIKLWSCSDCFWACFFIFSSLSMNILLGFLINYMLSVDIDLTIEGTMSLGCLAGPGGGRGLCPLIGLILLTNSSKSMLLVDEIFDLGGLRGFNYFT